MDPIKAFELAKLLFAGISAVSAAINIWVHTRNSSAAAAAFDNTLATAGESSDAHAAAQELIAVIPGEVIADLETRADLCWTGYRQVLGGPYLPPEIDTATVSVQACVCRELNRIFVLNASIPERWKAQWNHYECRKRLSEQFTK